MTRLVAVALYDRGHFSRGNARRVFGYEAYHWGIIIMPEISQGPDCQAFDTTDASYIDPITFRLTNPTMDWQFRVLENMDATLSPGPIGRIVIGQIPDEVSSAELRDFFGKVHLPVKNTHPQQSCVTWAVDAIGNLQSQGWVRKFELDRFKELALSYADDRIKGDDSREPSVKHYSI